MKKLVTGTALISSVNILRLIVQFVSLPLLARLLTPEDYGIVAMAMPIVLFVMLFADSGLASSLVREKSEDMTPWHSCFWLTTGLGASFCLLLAALSPVVSYWMDEPTLSPVMAALATVILLQSLTLIPGAALQQEGMFGRIALAEIAGIIVSLGVAIWAALNGLGVWALVGQQIALYAVRLFFNAVLSPYRPRLVFSWGSAKGHVVFGWNVFASSVVGFGSRSAENIIIGRFRGAAELGYYGMAFQFARLPWMIVTGPLQYVLYPLVAGADKDLAKLRAQALLASKVLAILLFAPMLLIGAASVPIFDLLLSEKWREAAYVFAMIIPAAAVQPVIGILGTFVLAIGRPDIQFKLTVHSTVLWMACLLSSVWFSLTAVAIAFTVSTLVFSLWSLRVMLPLVGCSFRDYGKAVGGQIFVGAVAVAIYAAIALTWPMTDVESIFVAMSLAGLCVLGSFLVQWKRILGDYKAVLPAG
ncbi:hypothetical protein C0V75_20145 [Tabrizicola sp. TH137]|uniref:lipopolysaccharide biosynthesis protein n=1 Tax=Tabrizicola sp. TH137 TaxID=2067452 RepID=UPI000C795B33|nr:lipopolysaccharide biosynthesis protein [Tabrizicola sp. TH137]PLL10638.1 hypothetical protein C0V75_20145 [Tabrizicola sp. TH137]